VIYKGLVVRAGDLGFSSQVQDPDVQIRAALSTSFAMLAIMSVLALNFWSTTMLVWSGRKYHPLPIDATTGVLTVATFLLLLILCAIVIVVITLVVRQVARGRANRVGGPSIVAAVSGAFVLYAVRWVPRMLDAISHLRQGGDRWIHPGSAAYGLAEVGSQVTQPWVSMWNPGVAGVSNATTIVNDLTPLGVIAFAVAIATLARRVELPRTRERLGSLTVTCLGALSIIFVVTLVLWFAAGGPAQYPLFGFSGAIAGVTYLAFMAIVATLVTRLGLRASGPTPRRSRNHIEIVG
jgi:hypothetical protein